MGEESHPLLHHASFQGNLSDPDRFMELIRTNSKEDAGGAILSLDNISELPWGASVASDLLPAPSHPPPGRPSWEGLRPPPPCWIHHRFRHSRVPQTHLTGCHSTQASVGLSSVKPCSPLSSRPDHGVEGGEPLKAEGTSCEEREELET